MQKPNTSKHTYIFFSFQSHPFNLLYEENSKKFPNSKETFQDKLLRVILTEYIAKGVFVPVSHLPKKEPKRAALPMAANQ